MKKNDLSDFVRLSLIEARPPIVGTPLEIEELLSVRGRSGIIHFSSSLTYQANFVVGYSLHAGTTQEQIKNICIHNQTKRYILVSLPDLERSISAVDVDNTMSLANAISFTKVTRGGKLKFTQESMSELYNDYRTLKHFIKSPTSVVQFRFVHSLRRLGIDIVKGEDSLGTKIVVINPDIIRTIGDLTNPYFRSNAGRPRKIDADHDEHTL